MKKIFSFLFLLVSCSSFAQVTGSAGSGGLGSGLPNLSSVTLTVKHIAPGFMISGYLPNAAPPITDFEQFVNVFIDVEVSAGDFPINGVAPAISAPFEIQTFQAPHCVRYFFRSVTPKYEIITTTFVNGVNIEGVMTLAKDVRPTITSRMIQPTRPVSYTSNSFAVTINGSATTGLYGDVNIPTHTSNVVILGSQLHRNDIRGANATRSYFDWACTGTRTGNNGRTRELNSDNTQSIDGLTVSPNPASTSVIVRTTSSRLGSIKVVNLQGQIVKSFESGENEIEIAIEDLTPGMYMIITQNNGTLTTNKLIVQ